MNRAQRRGNPRRVGKLTTPERVSRLQDRREAIATYGSVSVPVLRTEVETVQSRDAGGRFGPLTPAAVLAELPVPVTRQQRRHQARMLAKASAAWAKVTRGDGVLTLDGHPVDPQTGEVGHG